MFNILAATIAVTISFSLPAMAAVCGPPATVLAGLLTSFHEAPAFTAINGSGGTLTITLDRSTGSWSAVMQQGEVACIVASGKHWAAASAIIPQKAPGLQPNGLILIHDMQGIIAAASGDQRRLDWYDSFKNGVDTACCDKNDGHQIAEDKTKLVGTQWYVYLDDEKNWAPVPPQAVIKTPSIDGQAYLFRMWSPVGWSSHAIRCFIPPIPGY